MGMPGERVKKQHVHTMRVRGQDAKAVDAGLTEA